MTTKLNNNTCIVEDHQEQQLKTRFDKTVARAVGTRVVPVVLTGNIQTDASNLRAAANGGAQMAFNVVGGARDHNATLAALYSLRRMGRLVLMGSMNTPLPLSYIGPHGEQLGDHRQLHVSS